MYATQLNVANLEQKKREAKVGRGFQHIIYTCINIYHKRTFLIHKHVYALHIHIFLAKKSREV